MKKVLKLFLNLALVLGLACAAAFGQEGRDTRNLIVDDYFRIHRVSDPQISPDGKWVAFAVSTMDLKEDEGESRIWMVPAEGGEALPMTAKGSSASRPRWSPDGKYLSFLAGRDDDKSQSGRCSERVEIPYSSPRSPRELNPTIGLRTAASYC